MQKSELRNHSIPDSPGVYLFKKGKKVLYVGKATSLRDRIRSYFDDALIATRGGRIVDMVTNATGISFETTQTVLEALVREAVLIKKYLPRANVEGKDDKTFIYVVITDEPWQRVLLVRGKDLDGGNGRAYGAPVARVFGPFPSGAQLRAGLRLIRHIFPFYDTKNPIGTAGRHQSTKIEFNRQIGHYPRKISHSAYRRSIAHITLFLSGHTASVRKSLTKEMMSAARKQHFEEASELKRQLFALSHIQDVSLLIRDVDDEHTGVRIEAYDTAHLSGTNAIGVMVVLDGGVFDKKSYRTFRIRGVGNDDIASLHEILSRRLEHSEWNLPRAFVVDGGTTHKKTAEKVLADAGISIPVLAVVKDQRHRPREVIGVRRTGISEIDVVLANSEAHRFAIARHRQRRRIKV